MKIPEGWESYDVCGGDNNRLVECDGCVWKGREDEIDKYIPDLEERVDAGTIMPVGVCQNILHDATPRWAGRHCGSLVYYSDIMVIYKKIPGVLDQIVEAVEGG